MIRSQRSSFAWTRGHEYFLVCLLRLFVHWWTNKLHIGLPTPHHRSQITDQAYADDGVLFTDCPSKWPEILTTFDAAAETMGLHTSWQKTKIQNIGHGAPPSSVYIQASGQTVEAVDQFLYLGSTINFSDGRSTQEIHRRIGIASGIMGRLYNVWQQSRLSLATKLRVYNSLVLSILLYGCETWTILKSEER